MFARVTIRVSDLEAAWGDFAIAAATDGAPPTRHLHIGFGAPRRHYYGAFLLDPDGNVAEVA